MKKTAVLKRITALLCVLMLLLPLIGAMAESSELDEKARAIFKKRKTHGGMVVIAKDGEIVYELCYGYADEKAGEKVSPENYFRLASVSKLVTAVAVMRLVETGRLDLDENLGTILGGDQPYFAANPYFPKVSITPRMLMTHTSSIQDKGAFASNKPLRDILNVKKRNYSGFSKKIKPGTKYYYSNYGAGILGSVLEAITDLRLTDAARELIFDRMDIDAAYHPLLLKNPERITTTYKLGGGMLTRSYRLTKDPYREKINVDKDYDQSYGGLMIRGEDLCKIGIMLCDMGQYHGQQILEEATVREMISDQKGKGGIQADSPYGLNVERVTNLLSGHMFYGHQGMVDGVLCSLYFDPDTRFVFALVTNGCNTNAKKDHICLLSKDLFELLWNEYSN